MATQTVPVQVCVVPDAPTQREIENTLDALRRLSDAIAELNKKRAEADPELAQALSKDLSAAPLNIDIAVEKLKGVRSRQDALDLKVKACEELHTVVETRLGELKKLQPQALRAVVQAKLEVLEKQIEEEKAQEHLLKDQINALKNLLKDLEPAKSRS